MARVRGRVTDAELLVLEVLWEEGQTTIRRIQERLYPGGGAAHYATVQKLLERLARKGCVGVRRGARQNRYTARVARAEVLGQALEEITEKLSGGSLTPVLAHLLQGRRLTERERRELRSLIEESGRERGKGS